MNKRLIILAISLFAVMAMDAQNIIRPKVECPNGIYVNSYNGVLFYQRPDVSVTNRNLRLEAVFYYNSSSNKKNYGYGNGWSLGSELRFVNDSLGIIIEQGDGRRDLYTRYGNSFEAPAGVFSTLSFEGDGYLLTYKDGTKYYFADTVSKKVTRLKDRYDNALIYTYQNGNLATASDISGRSLYFSWNNGLLSGLSTSFDDRTWSYQYDEKGNLIAVTDPMGYTVHYAYNEDNRIKTFTDAEGYSTHITYNVDGMAHRIKTDLTDKSIRYEIAKRQTVFIDYFTDANNQYSKYMWDEAGRLVEIVNVNMGTSTKFAYDDDNNLIRREDANGHAYTYTYDQNGNCLSATDPLGYTEYYTYENAFNKVISYTDKMGHLYTYQYDAYGNLLQMNGPLNYNFSFAYNEFGRMISTTDANGNMTTYDYDNYGNMVSFTDAMGNITTMTYNMAGMPLIQTKPNGAETSFVYDIRGKMVERIDALNFSTTMQYDKKGNVVVVTDPLNNAYYQTYNALGQLVSIQNPLGEKTLCCYSGTLLTRIIDALNHITSYLYDDGNRLFMSIDASNDSTTLIYDNVGNIIGEKLPNGANMCYQYDELNRIVSVSDQAGTYFVYHYDANGNIIQRENELGYSEYYYYDALNRPIQHIDELGHSEYYSFDNVGNLLTYVDFNGNASILEYNANGRIISYTNALNHIVTYSYDNMGNLEQVVDANGYQTSYEYDILGMLKCVTFPNGKKRQLLRDAVGNVVMQENESGEQTQLTYDALNRVTAMNSIGNNNEYCTFQYDAVGNLVSAINQNTSSFFTYDEVGRKLSETTNGKQTAYSYQDHGNQVLISYPSGRQIVEKYDIRNRITSVEEGGVPLAVMEYDNSNALLNKKYANGIESHYLYDEKGRLVSLQDNHGEMNYQFVYDAIGNLLVRKDLLNLEESQVYEYDDLNRMIDYKTGELSESNVITSPNQNVHYYLDYMGNRTTVVSNGIVTEYAVNSMNAYTMVTNNGVEKLFNYDDKGNLCSDGEHTYQYNNQNQRIGVDGNEGVSYKYDALGRLYQVLVRNDRQVDTINYCYSGANLIEQGNVGESSISTFVYGMNARDLLQSTNSSYAFYYLKDQLGSTVALSDVNANILEKYSYDAFGNVQCMDVHRNIRQNSSYGNLNLFAGGFADQYTNTYQLHGRTYDTQIGRLVEPNQVTAPSDNSYSENSFFGVIRESVVDYFRTIGTCLDNPSDAMNDYIEDPSTYIGFFNDVVHFTSDLLKDWASNISFGSLFSNPAGNWSVLEERFKYVSSIKKNLNAQASSLDGLSQGLMLLGVFMSANTLYWESHNSHTFEDSWRAAGKYYGGTIIGLFFPIPGSSFVGQWVFGNYFADGGRIMDELVDQLEADCIDFMRHGLEGASESQLIFASIAEYLPTDEYFYQNGWSISTWSNTKENMRKAFKFYKDIFNLIIN